MYCDEALDAVEAIAANEMKLEGRLAEHYASCPNCASALDGARDLERLLQWGTVPQPSPQFTSRTLARVRRARWRSEQVLDVGFNVAVAGVLLALVLGLWAILRRSGLVVVGDDAMDMFGRGMAALAQRVAPSL